MKDSSDPYRWVALSLALLALWSTALVSQSLSPLAPLFQPDLGLTKGEVGMLSSASFIGMWSMVLLAGFLTDRFGIRWIVALGQVVAGLVLVTLSMVGSISQGVAVMFVVGLARANISPGSTKAVLDWFPPRTRATAMGVKQTGMPLAGIIAAATLPTIALARGWRFAIALVGFVIASAGVVTALFYREAPRPARVSAGSVGVRAVMGEVIRNRSVWLFSLVAFCFLLLQLAVSTYLALYFKDVVLVDSVPDEPTRIVAAGGYLALSQVGGAFGRVGWGVVSDRLFQGRRLVVIAIIGAVSTLMSVVMGNLGPACPLGLLAVIVLVFGATAVGWNGVYNALLSESIGRSYAATGMGLSMTLSEFGTVAGPLLFGLTVDLSGSYGPAWLLLSGFGAAGTIIAILNLGIEKPARRG